MLRSVIIGIILAACIPLPGAAQDSKGGGQSVAQQVEAIRQKVRAAADAAKKAQAEELRVREEASGLLAGLGADAIPVLLKVVQSADEKSDPDFIARCKAALEKLGYVSPEMKERMADLVQAIRDEDFDPAVDTVAVLDIGAHAVKELWKAFDSREFKDFNRGRLQIVSLLGQLGAAGRAEVLGQLMKRLGDASAKHRTAFCEALAACGEVATNELTNEPDPKAVAARDARVKAAGGIAPILAVLKHDKDAGVRAAAAAALGGLGRREAVAGLMAALADADGGVKAAAHEALRTVTGQELQSDGWAAWWAENKDAFGAQTATPAKAPGAKG